MTTTDDDLIQDCFASDWDSSESEEENINSGIELECEEADVESEKEEEENMEEVKIKKKLKVIDEAASRHVQMVAIVHIKKKKRKRKVKSVHFGLCIINCTSVNQLCTHRQGKSQRKKHFRNRHPRYFICRIFYAVLYAYNDYNIHLRSRTHITR